MSKLAFVFPGQGSQKISMLADIAAKFPEIDQTYAEASDSLGYDIAQLINEGPVELLAQTEKTQPALLAASIGLYRAWSSHSSSTVECFAGHSLGEYSAIVASGTMSFSDAIKLVELRGQLMQKAVPVGEGLMAAILGLTDEEVVSGCTEAANGDVVAAVNFNTPGQVVIAGQKAAVERAIVVLKAKGAKRALPLNVSVPSHCELMKPAAEQLAEKLESIEFKAPSSPIIQNSVATAVSNVTDIRQNLVEQLYMPVLWTRSVAYMESGGVTEIIECGPGKVLSGLDKRIAKEIEHTAIGDLSSLEKRLGQ